MKYELHNSLEEQLGIACGNDCREDEHSQITAS